MKYLKFAIISVILGVAFVLGTVEPYHGPLPPGATEKGPPSPAKRTNESGNPHPAVPNGGKK